MLSISLWLDETLSAVNAVAPKFSSLATHGRFEPKGASITRSAPTSAQQRAERRYLHVLPVLLLEYLALSLSRALLPGMLNDAFGKYTYHVLGIVETVKGILAFVACPVFGKLSDVLGRRTGLLVTVCGTTLPVVCLAFSRSMWIYAVAQGLSGLFASTFTITFAYIADVVSKESRSAAYGLALATFGLSYCIGPIAGGLISDFSFKLVFVMSVVLVVVSVMYIVFVLPESRPGDPKRLQLFRSLEEPLPMQWSPFSILEVFSGDRILLEVSKVVVLYYTGVWALVSTLMVHIQRHFDADEVTIGEIMSVFGVCTMVSEALLVRIMVPHFGEKVCMQIGLTAFTLQCAFVTFARNVNDIFFCLLFSCFANLVYPAVSSFVSRSVPPSRQGEALGALNGIRALTEGFGPLLFGQLMYACQATRLPGAPYLVAGMFSMAAFAFTSRLPSEAELFEYEKQVMRTEGEYEAQGLLGREDEEDEDAREWEYADLQQSVGDTTAETNTISI